MISQTNTSSDTITKTATVTSNIGDVSKKRDTQTTQEASSEREKPIRMWSILFILLIVAVIVLALWGCRPKKQTPYGSTIPQSERF
jgi:t-SNARE complex subunit (syntaxin)